MALEYGKDSLNSIQQETIMDFTHFFAYRRTDILLAALKAAVNKMLIILENIHDPDLAFDPYYRSNNYIFTRLHTITGASHIARMEGFCARHPIEYGKDKAISLLVPNIVAENYDITMDTLPELQHFATMPVHQVNYILTRRNAPLRSYYLRNFAQPLPPNHIVYLRDQEKNICPFCLETYSSENYASFEQHIVSCTEETRERCTTCWGIGNDIEHQLSLEHHWRSRRVVSFDKGLYEVTDIDSSNGVFMVNMGLFYAEQETQRIKPNAHDIIKMIVGDMDHIISSGYGIQLVYILQQIGFAANQNTPNTISCRRCNDALSAFSLLYPADFFTTDSDATCCTECGVYCASIINYDDFLRHFFPFLKGDDSTALVVAEDVHLEDAPRTQDYGVLADSVKLVPFNCGVESHVEKKKNITRNDQLSKADRMVLRHQRQKVHRYNVLSFRHVDMQPSEYRYGVPFCEYNKNDKRRLLANINPYLWAKKKLNVWKNHNVRHPYYIQNLEAYVAWPNLAVSGNIIAYKMVPGTTNLFLCNNRFFFERHRTCAVFVAARNSRIAMGDFAGGSEDSHLLQTITVEEIYYDTVESLD